MTSSTENISNSTAADPAQGGGGGGATATAPLGVDRHTPVTVIPADVATMLTSGRGFPTNVHRIEDLATLPAAFLSTAQDAGYDHGQRPLKNIERMDTTDKGNAESSPITTHLYALTPLTYSVFLILIVECFERFTWMTVVTQLPYLVGTYSPEWNAGMVSYWFRLVFASHNVYTGCE